MHSQEGTIFLVPIEYRRLIFSKLATLNEKLHTYTKNRKLYEKLVLKSEDKVFKNAILTTIKNNKNEYYTKVEIYNMFKSTMLRSTSNLAPNSNVVVYNSNLDANQLILTQYENFKKYVILEHNTNKKIIKYSILQLELPVLRYMFKNLFRYIGYYLLETGSRFSLPYNIRLKVVGKHRSNAEKKYGVIKNKVDWGESLKTLVAIAKDVQPSIHTAYISKNITKREFINQMKPYVYNKTTGLKLPKWIVLDTKELDFWLTIFTKFSTLPNISKYAIIPANGIAPTVVADLGIERKQSEFMKLVKDRFDIIRTSYLGFRDRLAMLEKYDLEYCMKTFDIR